MLVQNQVEKTNQVLQSVVYNTLKRLKIESKRELEKICQR